MKKRCREVGFLQAFSFQNILYVKIHKPSEVLGVITCQSTDWCSSSSLFLYGNIHPRVLFGWGFFSWLRFIRFSPCLLAVKWITDSLSTGLCVATQACCLNHISTVSATTLNSMAGEYQRVCVFFCCFFCVYVSVYKTQSKQSGYTKGWLIQFNTMSHF